MNGGSAPTDAGRKTTNKRGKTRAILIASEDAPTNLTSVTDIVINGPARIIRPRAGLSCGAKREAESGEREMKLMIAVPVYGDVKPAFMASLIALIERLKDMGVEYKLRTREGTLIHIAREQLAAEAINEGFTHILWLDSDMVFEAGVFERLMAAGKRFVSGVYCSRRAPVRLTIFRSLLPIVHFTQIPDGVTEIAGCGFGCALTEVGLLREVLQKRGTLFTPTREFSEDLALCVRVHDIGEHMYAHGGVRLGHAGAFTYWPQNIDAINAAAGAKTP